MEYTALPMRGWYGMIVSGWGVSRAPDTQPVIRVVPPLDWVDTLSLGGSHKLFDYYGNPLNNN